MPRREGDPLLGSTPAADQGRPPSPYQSPALQSRREAAGPRQRGASQVTPRRRPPPPTTTTTDSKATTASAWRAHPRPASAPAGNTASVRPDSAAPRSGHRAPARRSAAARRIVHQQPIRYTHPRACPEQSRLDRQRAGRQSRPTPPRLPHQDVAVETGTLEPTPKQLSRKRLFRRQAKRSSRGCCSPYRKVDKASDPKTTAWLVGGGIVYDTQPSVYVTQPRQARLGR